MVITNHSQSGRQEFITSGVPLHTVDFAGDPFDVIGNAAKFRVLGNWQDMVKRIIQAQHDFFASIGAAIVLGLKFLTDNLGVLSGFQAVNRRFLKVTGFTERVAAVFHRSQAGSFAAAVTQPSVSHLLFPSLRSILLLSGANFAVNGILAWWNLTAVGAKTLSFQAMVTFQVVPSTVFVSGFRVSKSPSLGSGSISNSYFFRGFKLAYSFVSHEASLLYRFADRLGSARCYQHFAEPLYFTINRPAIYGAKEV